MTFVYLVERDEGNEIDVYADFNDAREAADIVGSAVKEEAVFESSCHDRQDSPLTSTRRWLDDLRKERDE